MTVLTLLEQYLEDSAEITAPSHSVQAGHNVGTSLGEEARECKVLCSWVALLSLGLRCLTKTLLSSPGVVWGFFSRLSCTHFPTIFCTETKLVLFCHHSPVFLIHLSHLLPSHFLISYLFCSTLILCCSMHSKWPQKACQYSTLLRLFLLCNIVHNATFLLRRINRSNITNCITPLAFQESDLQNSWTTTTPAGFHGS